MRKSLKLALAGVFAFVVLLTRTIDSHASVESAVAYLLSAQGASGAWGEGGGGATDTFHTTANVLVGLVAAGKGDSPEFASGISFLQAQDAGGDSSMLAGRIYAGFLRSLDVSADVNALRGNLLANGSYGITKDFEGDSLHTAQSLLVLKLATGATIVQSKGTVEYLLATQRADGGWGLPESDSDVYLTAQVVMALGEFSAEAPLDEAFGRAKSFLISRQNPDSSFGPSGGTVFETAQAIRALNRLGIDAAPRDAIVEALWSRQLANGSWNDDPYQTALAVWALEDARRSKSADDVGEVCVATPLGATVESGYCTDGINNDCDGDGLDCNDPDCASDAQCSGGAGCILNPAGTISEAGLCDDGLNNDCDGSGADCADPDCANSATCTGGTTEPTGPRIVRIDLFKVLPDHIEPSLEFGAYQTVSIQPVVEDPPSNYAIFVIVTDPQGEKEEVGHASSGAIYYSTQNRIPGAYELLVLLNDQDSPCFSKSIRDRKRTAFTIVPESRFDNLHAGLTPAYSFNTATENLSISFSVRSQSNVASSITVNHDMRDPLGNLLSSGSAVFDLGRTDDFASGTLDSFVITFDQAGTYPLRVQVIHGGELILSASANLIVNPITRIKVIKSIDPLQVVPGKDQVRLKVHLEGVSK